MISIYFTPVTGLITQIIVTGKGIYHEEQFPRVKRPRSKPESREERKQRKYRYLYQVSIAYHQTEIYSILEHLSNCTKRVGV